jgi:hypothetical protein
LIRHVDEPASPALLRGHKLVCPVCIAPIATSSFFTGIYLLPTAIDFVMPNNPSITSGIDSADAPTILTVIDEEVNMDNAELFQQAKQIATTASLLDSDKNEFPDDARLIAAMCVNDLHKLAEILAGNQVGRIYL